MITRRVQIILGLVLPLVIAASGLAAAAPKLNYVAVAAPAAVKAGEEFIVKVTEKGTGAPVDGATVSLVTRYEPLSGNRSPKTDGRTALGTTSQSGELKLTLTEPGNYFLLAEKQDYAQGFSSITVGRLVAEISFSSDKKVYLQGETVTLRLKNELSSPITLASGAPWEITTPSGANVYVPQATQALVEVGPGQEKTWTWDQRDLDGKEAKPGVYVATLTTSSGPALTRFCISGLRNERGKVNADPEMPNARPFRDVTGSQPWGDPHIVALYQKGIVRGKAYDTFDPDGLLTRAEFLALLLRACGIEPAPGEGQDAFPDVTPSHWAYAYVYRAREMGIITPDEYPEGFGPDVLITRMEICVMAARTLGLEGEAGQRAGEALRFADAEEVQVQYRGYVASAVDWGVVKGYEDNTLRPAKNATRREAAVIVYRLMQIN